MAGLFRKNPETREGKYPVLLRRDGTVPERNWFVMLDGDVAAIPALQAYADAAESLGWDPQYVSDIREMAEEWRISQNRENLARVDRARSATAAIGVTELPPVPDPDGPAHRTDCPEVLSFPRSLQDFMAGIRGRTSGRSS